MANNALSDYRLSSIYDLSPKKVKELGFSTLICDLDNTLAPFDLIEPERRTYELVDSFFKEGIEVIIISNNTKKRVAPYADKLHVRYICSAHKPFSKVLRNYLRDHSINPQKVLSVGDQVINDMMMEKRIGLKTCLVQPLTKRDHISAKLIRPLDSYLRKKYKKQGRLGRSLEDEEKI
jgi:HAD superfamily phosphatase (TIGR01668 family)